MRNETPQVGVHYIDQRGKVVRYEDDPYSSYCSTCCYFKECNVERRRHPSTISAFQALPSPIELISCGIGHFKEVK